ncbi:MAG: transporter substrate-binding protein [Alkalinema sp. RU_4_3]|nr:transporter substrate-binding protein [Alkalinema sp. RU_4_3]
MTIAIGSSATVAKALEPIVPIRRRGKQDVIPVGILHSLSGVMAISEKSVVDAELLAIKEINQAGGLLGRQIMPQIEDGASDWVVFRERLEFLTRSQVVTVFGGWTSASRKSMLPTLEETGRLLWYPLTYEGQECSQNIMYTGLVPSQFVKPVVDWLIKTYPDKPFCLVGSDYVFPRVIGAMVRAELQRRNVPILMEDYIPLGSFESARDLVTELRRLTSKGAVIFSTLNGDSNIPFFKDLNRFGLSPDRYPVVSTSISEEEVPPISVEYLKGTYAIASYFQTVNQPASQKLVKAIKREYGEMRVVNDAMAAAYTAVYLWKMAVEKAGTATDLNQVVAAARGLTWDAPTGRIEVAKNQHLSQPVRIGKVRSDGLFDIVFESGAIAPEPWNQDVKYTEMKGCDWIE